MCARVSYGVGEYHKFARVYYLEQDVFVRFALSDLNVQNIRAVIHISINQKNRVLLEQFSAMVKEDADFNGAIIPVVVPLEDCEGRILWAISVAAAKSPAVLAEDLVVVGWEGLKRDRIRREVDTLLTRFLNRPRALRELNLRRFF